MNRLFRLFIVSGLLAGMLGGCVVEPLPAAQWVPPHYGAYGAWVPGHWR